MKIKFLYVLIFVALLVSACGGSAAQGLEMSENSGKAQASPVQFSGIIEAMDGNQWTINGQVFMVDDSALGGVTFAVGDKIEVEAEVKGDGSIVVALVKLSSSSVDGDDNGNENSNDNSNENSNSNGNENSNGNVNFNNNGNGNSNSNSSWNSNHNSNGNSNHNGNDNDDDRGNNNDDDDDDDDHDDDDDDDNDD